MKVIDKRLLDNVTVEAKESPRLRMNYNLHDSLDAKAQRLLNALEPGTELPIHRHTQTAETYIIIRGRMNVLFYSDKKQLVEKQELDPLKEKYGVHIPAGQWHTLEVLESGTIIFEVKDGPYVPFVPENMMVI
ncbi:WbuC family cupin fold metalloprotein [Bacteroides congonensis]|jgi:cupin fold WbuC family metalloprotein|uniref:WbuC family cupin fold metalloprotein n=1 Tax=Bacteroides congonensis TaxID=1871006 RepID=UPI000933FC1D|nr:WbuC family cupin fold metalloprotein [Bacteroides congonensis]